MLNKALSFLGYLVLVAVLGFAIRHFFLNNHIQDGANLSTEKLFAATLPDVQNVQRPINTYKGKTIVVNFWATWCPPCREEMPELSMLHQEYLSKNVQILGLAIDDAETIHNFQKENPVSYPLFAADMQGMEIAASLGNDKGVLPYTVIITPDGKVAKTFLGKVSKALLEGAFSNLISKN